MKVFVLFHEDFEREPCAFSTYDKAFQYLSDNFPDERWPDDRTKLPLYWFIDELEIDEKSP